MEPPLILKLESKSIRRLRLAKESLQLLLKLASARAGCSAPLIPSRNETTFAYVHIRFTCSTILIWNPSESFIKERNSAQSKYPYLLIDSLLLTEKKVFV